MSDTVERLSKLEPRSEFSWLKTIQEQGKGALSQHQWPTRKTEHWKYTNLNIVEAGGYLFSEAQVVDSLSDVELGLDLAIPNLPCHRLVFINGRLSKPLCALGDLPDGLSLVEFGDASSDQQVLIQSHVDTLADNEKHLFSGVNKHLLNNGVLLHAQKNTQVEKPIHVIWLSTEAETPCHIPQRLLAIVDRHADIALIEQFISVGEHQNCLTHGVTELVVGEEARLHHYRLHQEGQGSLHIGGVHASLNRNAYLNSFHMALGSQLKRVDIVVHHDGVGASCVINGVYLPQQDQHIDYHTCIEHKTPQCTSSESFRGIIGGNGRAVFNGRIHIHPDAQKTLANLSNKNLLTSNKAEIDSKPELEIYADDVQCTHGTTVAQLDEKALHYFQTRGISLKQAEVILSFGFIQELINEVKHTPLIDYLTPLLAELFAKDPNLARGKT